MNLNQWYDKLREPWRILLLVFTVTLIVVGVNLGGSFLIAAVLLLLWLYVWRIVYLVKKGRS